MLFSWSHRATTRLTGSKGQIEMMVYISDTPNWIWAKLNYLKPSNTVQLGLLWVLTPCVVSHFAQLLIRLSQWWISTEKPVKAYTPSTPPYYITYILVQRDFRLSICFVSWQGRRKGRPWAGCCRPDCVRVLCLLCHVAVHCLFCSW